MGPRDVHIENKWALGSLSKAASPNYVVGYLSFGYTALLSALPTSEQIYVTFPQKCCRNAEELGRELVSPRQLNSPSLMLRGSDASAAQDNFIFGKVADLKG